MSALRLCLRLSLHLSIATLVLAALGGSMTAAAAAPSNGGKTVRIVIDEGPVNVEGWLQFQRTLQFGCFRGQGIDPAAVPEKDLMTWDQAVRAFAARREFLYTPDAFLRDERGTTVDLDTKTCRWAEKPKRKVFIARDCKGTEIDFQTRAIRERPVSTPECLARAGAGAPRNPDNALPRDGETRTVAGQTCRVAARFAAKARACVLETMPIHPLADDRVVIAWEAEPDAVESARKARAAPPSREAPAVLGAALQLPFGRQGEASVVEVGKPIPAERFVIPPEAKDFARKGNE